MGRRLTALFMGTIYRNKIRTSTFFLKKRTKMRTKNSVGERIRKLRGMNTQTEFANLLGITQRAVVNYETQGRIPRGSILKKICSCFGVSEKWLLTGSDEVNNPTQQEAAVCSKMGDMSPILEQTAASCCVGLFTSSDPVSSHFSLTPKQLQIFFKIEPRGMRPWVS